MLPQALGDECVAILPGNAILNKHVLQKEEMSGVQYIDRLTGVMLQEDADGCPDTTEMTGIVFFGILEVCKAEAIDRNLLRFGSREGRVGKYLNWSCLKAASASGVPAKVSTQLFPVVFPSGQPNFYLIFHNKTTSVAREPPTSFLT